MKTRPINSWYLKMNLTLVILMMFLITVIFVKQVSGQGVGETELMANDNFVSLRVENIKTHELAFFVVGQTARYKIHSLKSFKKGRITGITDSTISFQNGKLDNVTFMHNDLVAFKIPRSGGKIGGNFLKVFGGLSLFVSAMALGTAGNTCFLCDVSDAAAPTAVIGLSALAGGLALTSDKQIYLEKSWTLKTTKSILPGNTIKMILKNGEVIKNLKVTWIDQEKIIGVQSSRESNGQLTQFKKTIMIKKVLECSRSANQVM